MFYNKLNIINKLLDRDKLQVPNTVIPCFPKHIDETAYRRDDNVPPEPWHLPFTRIYRRYVDTLNIHINPWGELNKALLTTVTAKE